ncbi:MAG TPA: xanthine dehydrogenase family protein molybdopterin-binding subunit [Candidatus Binatia bacterium]|nr:xanthine dehydrogenase family protein molybdopterin-binding subunit [Candidatus Binatia bacterium]
MTPEYRVEGHDKVSGRMKYTADLQRPGMLWAAFAVSPHAHARIRKIDTGAAKVVPGVKAVLTASEIGLRRFGRQLFDWPILAWEEVRFVGDRIAAVAAETREAAEEAARAIRVDYEELPALLDPFAALEPSAHILHPQYDSYHFSFYADKPRVTRPHPNVQGMRVLTKGSGDVEAILRAAYRVFEHRFVTPRQHAGFIEPRATLVWIDDNGIVHIHSTNKTPFSLRDQLAHVAEIPKESIVVEPAAIGGDFGGKGITIDEFPCYFLARATGRPVKYVPTYADELRSGSTRHRAYITLKTAVDPQGAFVAHSSKVIFDGGAYAAAKPAPWLLPGNGYGAIPYSVPDVRLEMLSVYTNTLPAGHMRSPGDTQTFFAWEQHVSMIAEALGCDPIEFRLQNAVRDGDTTLIGETIRRPMVREVLETLRDESGHGAVLQEGRARGISLICSHTGGGTTSLVMRLSASGGVDVVLGTPDQGAGTFTLVRRVAAAVLGIAPDRIAVRRGSTLEARRDPGTAASRVTHIVGRAALDAAERLRTELERRSGKTLRDGRFVDVTLSSDESFEEVAARACADEPIEVVGAFDNADHGSSTTDFTIAALSVEVEVDRQTGAFELRDALLVADVGQIINPIAYQGQINGGFVFGIGGALLEEMPIDEDGKVMTLSLGEYKLPTIMDIPKFRTIYVRAPDGDGPFGTKGAGELSNTPVAPAILNAVYNAVGVRLNEFPITAERIFMALHASRTEFKSNDG